MSKACGHRVKLHLYPKMVDDQRSKEVYTVHLSGLTEVHRSKGINHRQLKAILDTTTNELIGILNLDQHYTNPYSSDITSQPTNTYGI